MSSQHQGPTYGVLIECVIEDDDRCGFSSWIDLEQIAASEDVQEVLNCVTGKDQDPHPDTWNEEGTFVVSQVRGLPPRLSAYAEDVGGPFVDTLCDLAAALRMLSPEQKEPFLAWADSGSWQPGYLPDTGGHTSEDMVDLFLCETESGVACVALSDEQEFGLKKLELGLRETMKYKPEEVVSLCVSQSRLLRQGEKLIADMQQEIQLLRKSQSDRFAATLAELRAADAAISEAALQAEYRAWWSASYGAPPNAQAVSMAAAWGRHLLGLGLRRLRGA